MNTQFFTKPAVSLWGRARANKHTTYAGLVIMAGECLIGLAKIWAPSYLTQVSDTVKLVQKLALTYGLMAAGDGAGPPPAPMGHKPKHNMKKHFKRFFGAILILMLFQLICLAAYAQTNVPPVPGGTPPGTPGPGVGLALVLIPLLVPLIVAASKYFLPSVPGWMLPIIAPILGALLNYISTITLGTDASPLLGAALGSAGVGIREIIDQVHTRIGDGPQPPAPAPTA